MVAPTWNETSGVDHPAHLAEGWLVMKSVDGNVDIAATLAQAEAVSKGSTVSLSDTSGSHAMPITPLSKEAKEGLSEDVLAHIESLEKAAEAPAPVEAPVILTEAEEFAKAIDALPAGAREIVRKAQRDAAEASSIAKGLYDTQEDAKYEAFAKSLEHVPNVTAASAPAFRKMAETNPTEWETLSKSLIASEQMLAKSVLFTDIGTALVGTPGSAGETIEAMAKELQAADASLGFPEALAKAAEKASADPELQHLITTHRSESLRANSGAGE